MAHDVYRFSSFHFIEAFPQLIYLNVYEPRFVTSAVLKRSPDVQQYGAVISRERVYIMPMELLYSLLMNVFYHEAGHIDRVFSR